MTTYNGQTLTYDAIGNPLNYRDGITFTWQNGRELASYTKDGTTVTYTYDINSMRTSKNIEGVGTVSYVYENGLLMQMDYLGYIFTFSYDAGGNPIGFKLTGDNTETYYYYGANYRGDIIAIYNEAGAKIATGKLLNTDFISENLNYEGRFAVNYNPLRYRDYVYDTETGFYYLQSRYYDPTVCRFINADVYCATGQGIIGNNMFAYCGNNPIIYADPSGELVTYSGITYSGVVFHNVPAHQLGWYGQIKHYEVDCILYDVPSYDQRDYKLCWAFCQVMIEDYNAGITRSQEEAQSAAIDIAINYHNAKGIDDKNKWNRGGWPLVNSSKIYPKDIFQLYSLIKNNGPIYAYYNGKNGSHLVVVTGVNLYQNTVYTNNPWGKPKKQTYVQHLFGVTDMPSDYNMPLNYYYIPRKW